MSRAFRYLLIALALLFTQHAAQVHALSHLGLDLKRVAGGGKSAPPLGHPVEQCIAFHALDSALPILAFSLEPPRAERSAVARFSLPELHPPRIVFDSRAPPLLA